MDFIFMLTRQDRTITDCLELLDLIRPLRLLHVGFKDIGVDTRTLDTLSKSIRSTGATTYMEVVSTTPEACMNSARIAASLGIDRLLGGADVAAVQDAIRGTATAYYPFPGRPHGHPTKLGGSPAEVEAQCRRFTDQGCAGADLLAYRAIEADPLALVRAARRGLGDRYLIVAGSVTSVGQITDLARAGADAFTIGSAIFDGSYAPSKGSILSQLAAVQADCNAVKPAG
jgi:hypothetical protein